MSYKLKVKIKKVTGNRWYKKGETHLVQPKILTKSWSKEGIPFLQKENGYNGIMCDDCQILGHIKIENNDTKN